MEGYCQLLTKTGETLFGAFSLLLNITYLYFKQAMMDGDDKRVSKRVVESWSIISWPDRLRQNFNLTLGRWCCSWWTTRTLFSADFILNHIQLKLIASSWNGEVVRYVYHFKRGSSNPIPLKCDYILGWKMGKMGKDNTQCP